MDLTTNLVITVPQSDFKELLSTTPIPANDVDKRILRQDNSVALDPDDLRSAELLEASVAVSREADDEDDEERVMALLGLSAGPCAAPLADVTRLDGGLPLSQTRDAGNNLLDTLRQADLSTSQQDFPEESGTLTLHGPQFLAHRGAIKKLAQTTRFTVNEIMEKLAFYGYDVDKALSFFSECRRMVDDQFAQEKDHAGQARPSLPDKDSRCYADPCSSDTSTMTFPAKHTRARAAARAAQKRGAL